MIGERLSDRYELLSELGRGGMGVVYRARDPRLEREVAIKVIAPALLTPETEQRFQREAQIVAQMDHPAIVPIHDFGSHQGAMFFVMPIVEGDSLRDLIRSASLRLGSVLDIGIEIAQALDYSHTRGVVHRDIKPENLMVEVDEEVGVRVRIMDFGLARASVVSDLTKTGMLMGTMSYMSPEQVLGQQVDGRADLYSLGCVLYECVTNQVPFTGEMQAVLYRISHEVPQAPRELGADIDEELEQIILGCLAKKAEERPASAADLLRALRRYRTRLGGSERLQSIMATQVLQAPRPALAPFVGRQQEFGQLQQKLNAALAGECQLVLVAGEPGVGKTRLLDEVEKLASARQIRVLHGRFAGESGLFPYHGFCEAIQEYFRQKETHRTSSGLPDLTELAADLIALFPMLAEVEAIRVAGGASAQSLAGQEPWTPENRTEIFELLARTLTLLAGGGPLVLVLEDLHGAEVSIEALQYIVRRLGPTPTLIVGSYRPNEIGRHHPLSRMLEGFEGDRRFSAITLGPLGQQEHGEFLATLTGGSRISSDLSARLYEATEGNPFFTKEMVRSLMDSGGIAQDDTGAWTLSGGMEISSDALPATIQQAVEKRIGDLPDELRGILTVASVMGKSFEFDDLEPLLRNADDLDDAVDRLIQDGLLEEDRQSRGDRLTFSSAVVREVLYGELSRRRRRTLHRKFAAQLEKRHAGRLPRVYPQLVHHYSEGDVPDKTVEYGLANAARALDAFSPEEAVRSAKTALEFLDEEWEGDRSLEAQAHLLLAKAYRLSGNITGALKQASSAAKLLDTIDDEGGQANPVEVLLFAAQTAWQARLADEARSWAERGITRAREVEDTERLPPLLSLAATLANLRGEYDKATGYLSEAEELQHRQEDVDETEEILPGGNLVVALANPVAAAGPAQIQIVEEMEVYSNVCETLIKTDAEGNLLPNLSSQWELFEDGRGVRIGLRQGVIFHDGKPLTAKAVRESFERAARQPTPDLAPAFAAIRGIGEFVAGEVDRISGIEVLADDTLEIHFEEPLAVYPAMLADTRAAITRLGDDGRVTGSGPFCLASRDEQRVILERVEEPWRGEPAKVDSIEFRAGLTTAEIAAGFRAGEIDLARDLAPDDLETLLHDPRYRRGLVESPQKITYFLLFNTLSGPATSDPSVRRALSRVVRTRDLVWRTLGRFAEPATGLIPPGVLGHDPGRRPLTVSPEESREALAAAGLEPPVRLVGAIHPLVQDRFGTLLEALFGAWAELGVEVEAERRDMASFLELFHRSEGLDLLITRWLLDYEDADNFTHNFFHSRSGIFKSYFGSPETDSLLEAARSESRPGARLAAYRKFESLLLESAAILPLFHDVGYRLASPKLRGVRLSSVAPFVNYAELGKHEAAAPAPGIESGGLIRVPMASVVRELDPSRMPLHEDSQVRGNVFESLMRDAGAARVEPWLAQECELVEGGRRYRFRLRDDVRFHDGRRLTARDVRYSLERLLRFSAADSAAWFYLPIAGVQAFQEGRADGLAGFNIQSDRDFTIELEERVSFLPVLLATDLVTIIPDGSRPQGSSWREGIVGTGPFRVARFEPNERLMLERNPHYWRRGYPRAQRLEFRFGVPPAEILSGFREGSYSLAADLFPGDAAELRRDGQFARCHHEIPALSSYFAACNRHRGPLSNVDLRRRVFAAIDVERLVRETLHGVAQPASGLIPPGLLGHEPSRPRAAALGNASAPLDTRLTVAVHPVFRTEYASFCEGFLESLREAGLEIELAASSMAEYQDATMQAKVDLSLSRWNADYPDADSFAYTLNREEGWLGRLCGSEEFDRLIADGRVEPDPQARHMIYRRLEEKLAREHLLLPLFNEQIYRFARPGLEGLRLRYMTPHVAYEELRMRHG